MCGAVAANRGRPLGWRSRNLLIHDHIVATMGSGREGLCADACSQPGRPCLQTISGTPDAQRTAIQDVRVDHGRADIRVAEQFLHRSNVIPIFEQMRRK